MKNKNNITKIMLLTCLIVGGSVNAENFFTCVPEEDWFNKHFDLRMLEEKFKVAKTQINNDNAWELIAENQTSGNLPIGVYKVILKAGDGGASGKSQNGGNGGVGAGVFGGSSYSYIIGQNYPELKRCVQVESIGDNDSAVFDYECMKPSSGKYIGSNLGISVEPEIRLFLLTSSKSYTTCFGRKGTNGGDGKGGKGGKGGMHSRLDSWLTTLSAGGGGGGAGGAGTGGQGGGGAGAYFNIDNILTLKFKGGRGGGSSAANNGSRGLSFYNIHDIYAYGGYTMKHPSDGAGDGAVVSGSGVSNNEGNGCSAGSSGYIGSFRTGFSGGAGGVAYYDGAGANDWGFVYPSGEILPTWTKKGNDIPARNGENGSNGTAGAGGAGGQLMKSGEKSNPGDGYVKIYKYRG